MKAWLVHAWGEPETMRFEDVAVPEPGPGQVRVRVGAAGLNFFDILQVQGKYQVKPPFPFTPGAEVAGVVDAAGPEVRGLAAGDRVTALPHGGGLAEYCLVDQNRVFRISADFDLAEAAALPIVYHTTWFALVKRAALASGEWMLVHAGASGVGMAAIQIGRALGARVIATAGSAAKLEFSRAQGAEHTLDYNDPAWVDRVKEITGGQGADVICDPVGGDVFDLSTKCIATEGRLLVIGFASGRIPSIQANRILLKDISVMGVFWGSYVQRNPAFLAETHRALMKLHAEGRIHPRVSGSFRLAEAPQALRALAERRIAGKAVLVTG